MEPIRIADSLLLSGATLFISTATTTSNQTVTLDAGGNWKVIAGFTNSIGALNGAGTITSNVTSARQR
jgi:hypothetical protein